MKLLMIIFTLLIGAIVAAVQVTAGLTPAAELLTLVGLMALPWAVGIFYVDTYGLKAPLGNCKTHAFTAGQAYDVYDSNDYPTPQFIAVEDVAGFLLESVANGATGILITQTDSQGYVCQKATGAINDGQAVYWDPDGDPVDSNLSAGTGAATATDDATHIFMGYAQGAAASGDEMVTVQLEQQAPAKAV